MECCPDSGYHNPAPDHFYFEIVDPDTHKPLPEGERGLSVLTHLDRRGTVLLRYALGDFAALSQSNVRIVAAGRPVYRDAFAGG